MKIRVHLDNEMDIKYSLVKGEYPCSEFIDKVMSPQHMILLAFILKLCVVVLGRRKCLNMTIVVIVRVGSRHCPDKWRLYNDDPILSLLF